MTPDWAADYVGIPYESRCSSFGASDCWGLYRLIKRIQEGVEISDHDYSDAEDVNSVALAMEARHTWTKLDTPELGALIIFNIAGHPVHCGYVLDEHTMLHSLKGHNSAIERFDNKKWKSRVEGIYVYG